jgi:hypothetical protein
MRLFVIAVLAILASSGAARAQVNTEILRKRIKTSGYSVIVEESVTGDLGNTQGISIGSGLGGGWASEPHLIFAYGRFDFTRYSGTTSVNKTFAHARYDYEFERWLWGEVFTQIQSDEFQRLDLRNLVGAGPRFRIVHVADTAEGPVTTTAGVPAVKPPTQILDVYAGTAYMLERDVITAEVGATGPQNQSVQIWNRWSNYLTVSWQMDPRAIIATTLYAQPAINDFHNIRVLDETLFTFAVTKVFVAGISATVRYDSEPPTGVQTTDVEIKNTLGVTF